MMSKSVYGMMKKGAGIMQDNYPECLGIMFIVNAPMLFTGVWAIASKFVDEKTRAKIHILGSGYLPKLLEHVEKDQLISFLGGDLQVELINDVGPWQEYDLIDGAKRGDVVGVRRKDNPDGPVFTPQDLERLPNPKLSPEANEAQQAKWASMGSGEAASGKDEEKK